MRAEPSSYPHMERVTRSIFAHELRPWGKSADGWETENRANLATAIPAGMPAYLSIIAAL